MWCGQGRWRAHRLVFYGVIVNVRRDRPISPSELGLGLALGSLLGRVRVNLVQITARYSHSSRKTNPNPNTNLNPKPIITCVPLN